MTQNMVLPKPYRVLDIIQETDLEYTFRVQTNEQVEHGQFFQVSLPKIGEAPISVSAIDDGSVELTIRSVGKVTNELFRLAAGDSLFMRGPYGNSFPLHEFRGKDLVIIAGGTGVSPIRSTVKYFYRHPDELQSLHLIVGFKNKNSILFREDLKNFATRFHTIYTLDDEKEPGFEKGLVTEHVSKIPFSDFGDYNVVIVGPPVMMHFTALECMKHGASEDRMWLSFERRMSCGVGKCGHCKVDSTYICLDGPVFNYTVAKWLLD